MPHWLYVSIPHSRYVPHASLIICAVPYSRYVPQDSRFVPHASLTITDYVSNSLTTCATRLIVCTHASLTIRVNTPLTICATWLTVRATCFTDYVCQYLTYYVSQDLPNIPHASLCVITSLTMCQYLTHYTCHMPDWLYASVPHYMRRWLTVCTKCLTDHILHYLNKRIIFGEM
jgi:hypothetical protein